jgi:hypothetical protein
VVLFGLDSGVSRRAGRGERSGRRVGLQLEEGHVTRGPAGGWTVALALSVSSAPRWQHPMAKQALVGGCCVEGSSVRAGYRRAATNQWHHYHRLASLLRRTVDISSWPWRFGFGSRERRFTAPAALNCHWHWQDRASPRGSEF